MKQQKLLPSSPPQKVWRLSHGHVSILFETADAALRWGVRLHRVFHLEDITLHDSPHTH